MQLAWNPWGATGVVAMAFAWGMAAFVYFSNPARAQNRRLALVLALEGAVQVRTGLFYLLPDARDAWGMEAVHVTFMIALPATYLWFVATLETPLVQWLKSRVAAAAIATFVVAGEIAWFARPSWFVHDLRPMPYAAWEAWSAPALDALYLVGGVVSLFALVAAISAITHCPDGSCSRDRTRSFAIAFGARDALFALLLLPYPLLAATDRLLDVVPLYLVGTPLATILFVALVAYGIARSQLFDIDLRLKWTLKQSTIAGSFVAVFFVVSESAQAFFQSSWGPFLGIAATGVLLFALHPLQRIADRVADTAMPKVKASPEYVAYKKFEVYRAAVEGVIEDGAITERERAVLDKLSARLGLAAEDARQLEADVAQVYAAHQAAGLATARAPG